jgi:chromate transporter
VVLNLAVFFAYHVLWPDGFSGAFEWPLLLLGLAAGVALFRYRVGVIATILACGAAGLLYQSVFRPLPG